MKIILKDDTELQISGTYMISESQMVITFTNVDNYNAIRDSLSEDNMESVKYYSDDNNPGNFTEIEDFSRFEKAVISVMANGNLEVIFTFSKINQTDKKINQILNRLSTAENTNDMIFSTVSYILTNIL